LIAAKENQTRIEEKPQRKLGVIGAFLNLEPPTTLYASSISLPARMSPEDLVSPSPRPLAIAAIVSDKHWLTISRAVANSPIRFSSSTACQQIEGIRQQEIDTRLEKARVLKHRSTSTYYLIMEARVLTLPSSP